jgi:hypothetical protein
MRFLVALSFLFLAACGNPLTRLVPKIEMPAPPADLMKPPQSLKTIVPPVAPTNVPPAG